MAIKAKMAPGVAIRTPGAETRIIVKMGTSGIEAGARDVLGAFVDLAYSEGLMNRVTVMQNGNGGALENEPIVYVYEEGKEKVTYVNMTADKAKEVVEKHIKGGSPVTEYTKA